MTQLPEGVLVCRLHLDDKKNQWFCKYEVDPTSDRAQKLPKKCQQNTKQKVFDRSCSRAEHAAFQLVLRWLWDKHLEFSVGTVLSTE